MFGLIEPKFIIWRIKLRIVSFAGCVLGVMTLISGCTSTQKVAVSQPGDRAMSCVELTNEFDELDNIMADARSDKGVNTANVAAAVFFWPAAVGNYMNAADAEKLVNERRNHLMKIYDSKNCDGAAAPSS